MAQYLPMNAEIIAIGDELTSGQRLDTNSQWLSQQLQELGVIVRYHTTVADDMPSMINVFRTAAGRCEFAVVTGGLGPTADDLTRQAIATAANVELETDDAVQRDIESLFQRRGRDMPDRNRLQAMFPVGSRPIPNRHGTAPGIDLQFRQADGSPCRFFALPGVPAEMREMWLQTVAPAIREIGGGRRIVVHRRIKCFGAGESAVESLLPDLIRRGREPAVGITVHAGTITLRVTATGGTAEECDAIMGPTIETIYECLGSKAFGEEDDELQHAVSRLLRQQQKTLATAEWGTSGRLGHWLTDLPDAREIYRGGTVSAADTAEDRPESSELLAHNAADDSRKQYAADYGLAIGPIPTDSDSADGKFFFALAGRDAVTVRSGNTGVHPAILKELAAKQALDLLRITLLRESKHKPRSSIDTGTTGT
ncbi:MAG: CinA family nicotinamide mononucleotide deamidase-related protein [Planctomycetota bacterium]|nr:CinA family nicotinamide mononucleotide deamidase-related protein [Planctomycetota bacterium]